MRRSFSRLKVAQPLKTVPPPSFRKNVFPQKFGEPNMFAQRQWGLIILRHFRLAIVSFSVHTRCVWGGEVMVFFSD